MNLNNPGTKKEHKVKQILSAGIAELESKQNERLNSIEEFVKKTLGEQGERSKAIYGFIMQEVQYKIASQLWNMSVTMDAFLEVMKEAGLPIEDFAGKLDAKKQEIQDRKQKEAEEKMKERMQQESKPAEPVQEPQQENTVTQS